MAIPETLRSLRTLDGPNRKVDVAIAVDVGYHTGKFVAANNEIVDIWLSPAGQQIKRIPPFTELISDAMALVEIIQSDAVGAVAWDTNNQYRAVIEGGAVAYGPNAAIAICIAAFDILMQRDNI